MKNLKPSQLPLNTVIDVPDYGTYLKVEDGIWEEAYSGCCSYTGRISDDGRQSDYADKYGLSTDEKADDLFKDFEVISAPIGYDFRGNALELHGPWVGEPGIFSDGSGIHECKGVNCEY